MQFWVIEKIWNAKQTNKQTIKNPPEFNKGSALGGTVVSTPSKKFNITFPLSGVFPCRGDHTFADSYLTIVPRGTEFVVFSIDGSFAASVSIMGSDPKVRAGAVDVVR